jgi:aminopeptidase N
MMDFFLTRGYFQNGLQEYLETFKYGNTESDDLWAALTKAVKNTKRQVDVKTVMDTWTLQMGFPVVTITKMADRAVASQKRFLLDGKSDPNESPFGYKWEIPLTYTTEKSANWDSKTSNIEWMHKDGADKTFTGLDANSWIIGNIEQMGYYRVNYDADNWGKITTQLNNQHQEINVKNRAQILDDAFNLARADLLHYKTAFKLTKYMENENEYTPWDAAMNGLAFVRNILSQTSSYGKYMKYMKKIGLNKYNSLAAKFDSSNDSNPLDKTYLRAIIVNLMCGSGHEDCLTKSTTQLRKWMTDSNNDPDMENPIDLNLRSQIYCYGIEAGDADIWDFMWEKYKAETVAAEKKRIMLSLACTKEPWILKNLLKMSIEKKDIRKQDGASVIQAVASKEVGNPFAWNFIRTNWDYLHKNYGQSMSFARVILAVSSSFSDEWKLYELESFMKAHEGQLGSATRGFNQAVEKTIGNIKWIMKNLKEVDQWLEDNST